MKKITIGSRGSQLSKAYVKRVKKLIIKSSKNLKEKDFIEKVIKTSGDIYKDAKLSDIGGKKLFCKEIEEELLSNKIDIAVHSLKDMEAFEKKNLIIAAYLKRNDPRDAFISENIKNLYDLNSKILIGSSSRRRELQLKKINKNISFTSMRGNIDTRIKKLSEKNLDGIVLAAAGIKSLKMENKISFYFETEQMIPAAGQGIVAVQCRKNDKDIKKILGKINDKKTSLCAKAERSMIKVLGGDCDTAVGGIAEIKKNNLNLKAELFSDDGEEHFICDINGKSNEALKVGQNAGKKLLRLAGKRFKRK